MSNRPILRRIVLVLGLMGILMALADVVARRELTQAAHETFGRGGAISRTAEATD
ncbi:hypothetical protein [Methylobacterium sp. CM6246]